MNYYPKRPIKSFQDLEVYQKLLAVCVAVVKRSAADLAPKHLEGGRTDSFQVEGIVTRLHQTVLSLPVLIATAHSVRFSNQSEAIAKLEEAMLNCNLAVVYLEQYRDLRRPAAEVARSSDRKSLPKAAATTADADIAEIESFFFEEQIKTLLTCRFKVMHLQMSWKKFFGEKNEKV